MYSHTYRHPSTLIRRVARACGAGEVCKPWRACLAVGFANSVAITALLVCLMHQHGHLHAVCPELSVDHDVAIAQVMQHPLRRVGGSSSRTVVTSR